MTLHTKQAAEGKANPQLLWDVSYQGAHTNIFVKKMERALQIETQLLIRERYVLCGKKLERAVFQHSLETTDWNAALAHTLSLVRKLAFEWLLTINDAEQHIEGKLPGETHCEINAPSGLYTLRWTLTRKTDPVFFRMAGADMW